MPSFLRLRRIPQLCATVAAFALALAAQTSTPHTSGGIPMREEGHHHLLLANQYVNVFFVEIPAHETTLLHHHDLPYVSVPPGGAEAPSPPTGSAAVPFFPTFAHVAYAAGNFSHAVENSGDVTLRNVAVELVRPQGTVRNRCAAVLRDQPIDICDPAAELAAGSPARRSPLFETNEILVESWELGPATRTRPLDDHMDMLIAGLTDVRISGNSKIDSVNALRGGELWVPAGSKPVFKTAPDRGGHFIAITFKDSGAVPH
jgi:hypothetical protein